MSEKIFRGKVSLVHNKTNRVSIEYITGNKTKTITAIVDDTHQQRWIDQKLIRKTHRFLSGDHVRFVIHKSSAGVFYADQVVFEYNHALEVLINKAKVDNRFAGYVKLADDQYFIKEIDSYLFIPLQLSRFEIPPTPSDKGTPVSFQLLHIDQPERIAATLYNHRYEEGFNRLLKLYKSKEPIKAKVTKLTPYGIYLSLEDFGIECKISIDAEKKERIETEKIQVETLISVMISHIGNDRLVLEWLPQSHQE